MKKWDEERRKKQHSDKLSKVKSTLQTQPKGLKNIKQNEPSEYQYDQEINCSNEFYLGVNDLQHNED